MKVVRVFALLACLAIAAPYFFAQEGHPVTGTWSGDYGPARGERTQTTLILQWDGSKITGLVDPGPDSANIRVATLDSSKWAIHMEYDLKDKAGKPTPFIVDGKLENASSRGNRMIVGTYTHGSAKGEFKIKLDL